MKNTLLLLASVQLCLAPIDPRFAQAATFGSSSLDEVVAHTFRERAILTPPESTLVFGQAVSISGNRTLVGAEAGSDGAPRARPSSL